MAIDIVNGNEVVRSTDLNYKRWAVWAHKDDIRWLKQYAARNDLTLAQTFDRMVALLMLSEKNGNDKLVDQADLYS